MNENEFKSRLQKDADTLHVSFSEEMLSRIMTQILENPEFAARQTHSDIHSESHGDTHSDTHSKAAQDSSFTCFQRFFHHIALCMTLVCASVFIGIGVWTLMNGRVFDGNFHGVSSSSKSAFSYGAPSVREMEILPAPDECSSGSLFNLQLTPELQLSVCGTGKQPLSCGIEDLTKVIIPGQTHVCLCRVGTSETQPEPKRSGNLEVLPSSEELSDFFSNSTTLLNTPVVWIFEEDEP